MKRLGRLVFAILLLLISVASPAPAAASTRLIVRVGGGLPVLQTVCRLLGCSVKYGLGDPAGQVFLVTTDAVNLDLFLQTLKLQLGVASVELDMLGGTSRATTVPAALNDRTANYYFGTPVWNGYVNQPATGIIGLAKAQKKYDVDGHAAIVAVIDTGVDTTHPVLAPVLVQGYDFTRNRNGGDEKGDIQQSTVAVVDGVDGGWVNQSTVAVVDQSTVAVVDTNQYAAFGHGTMVAGVVHLVAPTAQIMPLKAFGADGSGYTSDVIRAIYYAVRNSAKVLNMSFSFASPSQELSQAINYASRNNVIAVASVGNDGKKTSVYPAAYSDRVLGVASTDNSDNRSSFSNYGQPLVFVAAPGEGIVSTYPWQTYAAAWGTSFSTPFVAGTVALLVDVNPSVTPSDAAQAIGQAKYITADLGKGRLDVLQAVTAWRHALGLQ
jgi:subtilisin family serine protease